MRYLLHPIVINTLLSIVVDEIIKKLDEILGKPEANAYILMEKLKPLVVENCVVGIDHPPPLKREMVSELGIYGGLLR